MGNPLWRDEPSFEMSTDKPTDDRPRRSQRQRAEEAFGRRDEAISSAHGLKGDDLAAKLREMVSAHEEGKAIRAEESDPAPPL